MSRNGPSQAELASLEFDLAATLSAKTEQRDKAVKEYENVKQGADRLTRMAGTLDDACRKLRIQIDEVNAEAASREKCAIEDHAKDLQSLEAEQTKHKAQLIDAKSQYDCMTERLAFVEARFQEEQATLNREIAEAIYTNTLLRAKSAEVRSRVEAMKRFIQVNHPEVDLELPVVAPSLWGRPQGPKDLQSKERERAQLEADCAKLQRELEQLQKP
jgi:chromosome segregation ATPase